MPASDQKVSHEHYSLVPRTLIFLTCGENVLLLKGAPQKRLWAGQYNGVGGHIERGEDVLSSVLRVGFARYFGYNLSGKEKMWVSIGGS